MEDFVSNAFFKLIAIELEQQGLDVRANSQFTGKAERSDKATMLDEALAKLGPVALLKIGEGIHRLHFDPTLALMLKAVSVQDLLERWSRLEKYLHGQHRVKIVELTDTSTILEHYSVTGEGPSVSEDLVVAGLFAALFHAIGVKKLSASIGNSVVISDDVYSEPKPRLSSTQVWTYLWDDFKQDQLGVAPLGPNETAVDRVRLLLLTDPGRSWKLPTVADILATSTRSLQRRLEQSGVNFQTLLRSTRADSAATMLLKNEYGLSEVSYATGFADQAHFSREFKLRFNMSPTEYIALSR